VPHWCFDYFFHIPFTVLNGAYLVLLVISTARLSPAVSPTDWVYIIPFSSSSP
jgi:hypothetical protein